VRQANHAESALAAEAQLEALAKELDKTHPGAAASLREGLCETRKRPEGKIHTQALLALARRLVDVVWALLRDGREFQPTAPVKAAAAA
jgi:hypothetical protein